MWFRKFLLSLMTILLGLMGIVFGGLFLLCLGLYVLWNSVGLGIVFFGLIGLVSLVLARMAMRRVSTKEKPELSSSDTANSPELDWSHIVEKRPISERYGAKRHKIT